MVFRLYSDLLYDRAQRHETLCRKYFNVEQSEGLGEVWHTPKSKGVTSRTVIAEKSFTASTAIAFSLPCERN